jgi:hypothetical protein
MQAWVFLQIPLKHLNPSIFFKKMGSLGILTKFNSKS